MEIFGLQTTESIFRYFESGGGDPNDRSVLVKIIVSKEEAVRDSIIRATNNQTDVEVASLHATDKIQRDIEDILERNGLFYERRKNYYINLGHLPSEIITPLYLASGYVNLILKSPLRAASLRSRFMRSPASYNTIFSPEAPINVWPKIAMVLKRTDNALENLRPTGNHGNENFLKNWRHITCFLTISRLLGTFDFPVKQLIEFDANNLTNEEIEITWKEMHLFDTKGLNTRGWRRQDFVVRLCQAFSDKFRIANIQRVGKLPKVFEDLKKKSVKVDLEFALKVHALLPPQPWKPGIHREVVKALNCTVPEYFGAVKILIDEGLRNQQKDGVVYDSDGNVLAFDTERVDPNSLKLMNNSDIE